MLKKRRKRTVVFLKNCPFCKKRALPNYKDYQILKSFLSERVKILSRDKTGVCAKHQRCLSREIKKARHLALLPFVVKPL